MKYFKTLNLYKNSTGTCKLNPSTMESYSYDWYQVTRMIDGVLVFNAYNYSSSTIKHQYLIRHQLDELGYREYIEIECPQGLQNLDSAIGYYNSKIKEIETKMIKGTKKKNIERLSEIEQLKSMIETVKILKGEV